VLFFEKRGATRRHMGGESMLTTSVEVLWTARYDYKHNWKLAPHAHDYFQMIYFLSGSGCLFLGDRDYLVQPGDLFLIKPHKKHALAPYSSVKTLDLKFRVYEADLRQSLLKATDRIREQSATLATLFERIRCEGETTSYLYRESCNLSLLQILIHYLRQDRHAPDLAIAEPVEERLPGDEVVRRALEFIRSHYAEDLDLPRIAGTVQRSDRHIRQHFEKYLGVPPMRYLVQYRIRRAKELIQYSDYALKEIAELVGFKSIHHFTRVFREVAGESPGAWRRKYRAGICKDVCIQPHFSNVNWTFPQSSACAPTD
jgi:AraC-like DNA-binding protein/mannose-6-phosphate isomerase-like protein (cupin superfamily)